MPAFGNTEKTIKEQLEYGEVEDEWVRIYQTMEQPEIRVEWKPCHCMSCKEFYNAKQITLLGKKEKYQQMISRCSACGMYGKEISCEKIKENGTYGSGECNCKCPKCEHVLHVIANGIFD
ncbi:MAG: hypothetical protein ACI4HI_12290 [Lachnospiraceae bacterium]